MTVTKNLEIIQEFSDPSMKPMYTLAGKYGAGLVNHGTFKILSCTSTDAGVKSMHLKFQLSSYIPLFSLSSS